MFAFPSFVLPDFASHGEPVVLLNSVHIGFFLFPSQYLHEKHILHRDLKTQNVFLTRTNIIKVGDLGIARVLENQCDMASTLIGTPYYMSPELFSNKPYNYKVQ